MTPPLIAVLGIGFTEGLLILLIIIFLFGAAKLPALGRAIGETIKEFKKGKDQDRKPKD